MPKVLVLFDSGDQRAERFAELASEGAKSVRFTEVDVRVVGNGAAPNSVRWLPLESSDAVAQYDGVVVVGSDQDLSTEIDSLLARLGASSNGQFVDRVFAVITEGNAPSERLSGIGGIVVGVPAGRTEAETTARKTGARVAKVAEWVRHALSHEHR